jgi:hypothetical protein
MRMTRVIAVSATTGALALTGVPAAALAGDEGGWDHFGHRDKRVIVVCKVRKHREFRHHEFRRDRFRDDFRRDRFRDREDFRLHCVVIKKRHHHDWGWGDEEE